MTFSIICNACGEVLRPDAGILRHTCRAAKGAGWLFGLFAMALWAVFLMAVMWGGWHLLDAWIATGRPTP